MNSICWGVVYSGNSTLVFEISRLGSIPDALTNNQCPDAGVVQRNGLQNRKVVSANLTLGSNFNPRCSVMGARQARSQ